MLFFLNRPVKLPFYASICFALGFSGFHFFSLSICLGTKRTFLNCSIFKHDILVKFIPPYSVQIDLVFCQHIKQLRHFAALMLRIHISKKLFLFLFCCCCCLGCDQVCQSIQWYSTGFFSTPWVGKYFSKSFDKKNLKTFVYLLLYLFLNP